MTNSATLGSFGDASNAPLVFRNKIINGDVRLAQRGTSFTSAADGTYTLDRWKTRTSYNGGTTDVTQTTSGPTTYLLNSLKVQHKTATATATSQWYAIRQIIEKSTARQLVSGGIWTLSFWYKSNRTGNHAYNIDMSASNVIFSGTNLSQTGTFAVNAADTWEYKTITITGYTISGNGANAENDSGCFISFGFSVSGQTTFTSIAVNDYFEIAGVQAESGNVATPFEQRPIGMELSLCQRYFQSLSLKSGGGVIATGSGASGNSVQGIVPLIQQMRANSPSATATIAFSNILINGVSGTVGTLNNSSVENTHVWFQQSGTNAAYGNSVLITGPNILVSAEL